MAWKSSCSQKVIFKIEYKYPGCPHFIIDLEKYVFKKLLIWQRTGCSFLQMASGFELPACFFSVTVNWHMYFFSLCLIMQCITFVKN